MSQSRRSIGKVTLPLWLLASGMVFASGRPIDIPERARGADRIVVATTSMVTPHWRTNAHGDHLIVSELTLQVEETLKGVRETTVPMELEGGTLDGVTLRVSDLPELKPGERGVFFLDRSNGGHVPHLRGLGILKLDGDVVRGSALHLQDIRRMTMASGK